MKKRLLVYLLIPVVTSLFLLLSTLGLSVIQSSPIHQFNVSTGNSPEGIWLNWTNNYIANIPMIAANTTYNNLISVNVYNETAVSKNYTQPYGASDPTDCSSGDFKLLVQNDSFGYNRTIGPLNSSNPANISLILNYTRFSICRPGRYYTSNYTFMNSSQANESLNISVTIDIPISSNNTVNLNLPTTGSGGFGGTLSANATLYHSYYFNTSELANATSVAINLSGWSAPQDLDMFLFDNSVTPLLKTKSINKTSETEYLLYNFLNYSAPSMWEIRVYGNNTTSTIPYSGNIFFSTLNATNSNDATQQVSSINFNATNVTTNSTYNLTLKNEGMISLSNVAETKELYYVRRYGGSGNQSFFVFIPDSSIATRVKVSLNWTGGSNYSFNLYDQSGIIRGISINKYPNANKTAAEQEEYNDTTSIGSAGTWNITVTNTATGNDPYNLTVYTFVNPSSWITTNYSTSTFINRTYNSSTDVKINLTIPTNVLDGNYEGYVKYLDNRNAGLKIPIYINVTTPVLIVNDTLNTGMLRVDENYGANSTKLMFVTLNNTGTYDLALNVTNSSNLTVSGNWANFTFNSTNSIANGSSQVLSVNITFNSTAPVGVYDGWISFNGTNSTPTLSSPIYRTFNLTVRLNLTNLLNVYVVRLKSFDGYDGMVYNASVTQNLTHKINITYINGTPVEAQNVLSTSNFSINFTERNTSYLIPTSGSLTLYNGTIPLYCTGTCLGYGDDPNFYYVNASVPYNQTGGRYTVRVSVNFTKNYSSSYFNYIGVGINNSLVINNSGLSMSSMNGTDISMANGSSYLLAVNVTNYGPIAPSIRGITPTLALSENCTGYSVSSATPTYVNCPSTSLSPSGYNTSCVAYWTITAANSNYTACTAYITGTPSSIWFNPYGVNVSVTITKSDSSTTSSSSSTTADTTVANLAFTSVPTLVAVQQNSTNTTRVQVKNTGTKIQSVTFKILDLNSSWYTINYTLPKILDINKVIDYLVTFNVGDVEVKDYNVAFKAYSSEKSVTSNFTLRVMPAPAKQIEISNAFNVYLTNFTKLGEEINKSKAEGANVTNSTNKYNLVKAKIDTVQTYANNKDYFNVNQLLPEIKSLLDDAWATLAKDRTTIKPTVVNPIFAGGYLTYAIIGGAVVGGSILAYLFWPTKTPKTIEYKPEKKQKTEITISEEENKENKLEDVFKKLKEKWNFSKKEKVEYKGS